MNSRLGATAPTPLQAPITHSLAARIIAAGSAVVASNVFGNYALSRGMHQVGIIETWSPVPYIRAFAHPWVVIGVILMTAWFVSRLVFLSFADLSYCVPITSVSYVFTALAGVFLLHERVDAMHWFAICLVAFGAAVVGGTQPQTSRKSDLKP